jgi:hypothetical protein|tara:strand:+ start:1258 stop:1419 length:162 start_codon:yes stop_codon:yes gene_type:complete
MANHITDRADFHPITGGFSETAIKIDIPKDFLLTSSSGVVRPARSSSLNVQYD